MFYVSYILMFWSILLTFVAFPVDMHLYWPLQQCCRNSGLLIYLLTYLRTARSSVLEKPTGCQLVKKFPAFYGTRKFITAFNYSRHHLSLSWTSSIQSMPPTHLLMIQFNLITVQQDATYSLYYISVGSSTCFGCWHPSSGARTTVITAYGID